MPELIKNENQRKKQDCKINTAKRLLPQLREEGPQIDFVWLLGRIYITVLFIKIIPEYTEGYTFYAKKVIINQYMSISRLLIIKVVKQLWVIQQFLIGVIKIAL